LRGGHSSRTPWQSPEIDTLSGNEVLLPKGVKEMQLYTLYSGKRLNLAIVVALTAAIFLFGAGCTKDENPPVIQQVEMPKSIIEGESIDFSVTTADDRGVQGVYIQFGSGDKIPLTKMESKKNGEEVANWGVILKLAPKEKYQYSIVARDTANETRKEGEITVLPNDANND
jgi:hypothetical protein